MTDGRLLAAGKGWSGWEIYQSKRVVIPTVFKCYEFEYLPPKKPADSEKQLILGLGWVDPVGAAEDAEAFITVGVFGQAALYTTVRQVNVQISRAGGAEIHVLRNRVEQVCFPAYRAGLGKGYISYNITV